MHIFGRTLLRWLLAAAVACGLAATCCAQDNPSLSNSAAGVLDEPPQTISATTVGIMLSSIFAYSITVPGLMLYFAGMVRRKNVLSVMMQCLGVTLLMSIVWVAWAASLALGVEPFLGTLAAQIQVADGTPMGSPDQLATVLFLGATFVLATCLICGALVERMRLLALVLFSVLWATIVFCPLCRWTLQPSGTSGLGWFAWTLDSAGAQAIHLAAGISALVSAVLVGRRLGYGMDDMRPHNLTYTTMGTALVWLGALGFHFGLTLTRHVGASAVNALFYAHLSMAGGALAWGAIEWLQRRRASILGIVSGVVAGFAGAAAGASQLHAMFGLPIGAAAGAAAFAACGPLKSRYKYDDSLDIFGVHAVAAAVGLVLVAALAGFGQIEGPMELPGFWQRLRGVSFGLGFTVVYSATCSLVILKVLDWLIGLRVPQESEMRGLDLSQHGQEGYIFN